MSMYSAYVYDVWGNAEDGWDVNDSFYTGEDIDIPPDGNILKLIDAHDLEIDPSSCDEVILLTEIGTGKPVGELRRQEETEL